MVLLPIAIYSKSLVPPLIVGFCMMSFLVALGWLPFWILLLITIIVAFLWGDKIKNVITGGE